jgi:RNA polymerase sigma factor (sigma-70 family)
VNEGVVTHLVENRDLLERFRLGERLALTEVYSLYAPAVFSLLQAGFSFESKGQRVTFGGEHDPGELENLVQEVFVRAFAEAARMRYDGLRSYANYLFAIARNLVADAFRDRRRTFASFDETTTDLGDSSEVPTPLDLIANEQRDQLIRAFRADLRAFDQSVFLARFAEGLSIEATSRRLGVTEYRVKRTEQNVRKRFFALMRRHGYLEGHDRDATLDTMMTMLIFLAAGGFR